MKTVPGNNRPPGREGPELVALPTETGPLYVPLEIRRSKRSKYIRAWVDEAHRVILSVPWNTSFREGMSFLKSHGDWIADQLKKIPPRKGLLEFLQEVSKVTVHGELWPLEIQFTESKSRYRLDKTIPRVILYANPHAETETGLFRIVRQLAKQVLLERTQHLARQVNQQSLKIVVRNQRSRWGSCSGKREISLNWRLLFLSPPLQDYVILHELAHLEQMNHGADFWKLLKSYDPRAKRHDQMLHQAAAALMPIGRGL